MLLVVDVSGQAQSAAAVVKGCADYDPRLRVAGVVVNRVGSERHRRLVSEAIEALGMPIVGALPRDEAIALPERHLGLVQAGETAALDARLEAMADFVEAHVDCGRVRRSRPAAERGRRASDRAAPARPAHRARARRGLFVHLSASPPRLAGRGAEIALFSPLADEPPPDGSDVCWLPGGYPELHAGRLAAARRFLDGLRASRRRRPSTGSAGAI